MIATEVPMAILWVMKLGRLDAFTAPSRLRLPCSVPTNRFTSIRDRWKPPEPRH